ncbi:hypothetical protein E2P81_ATG01431 [Venturia nashicola]|nr:hypothetical protein E2P81_ATG01431 [Venturia nashicola]
MFIGRSSRQIRLLQAQLLQLVRQRPFQLTVLIIIKTTFHLIFPHIPILSSLWFSPCTSSHTSLCTVIIQIRLTNVHCERRR